LLTLINLSIPLVGEYRLSVTKKYFQNKCDSLLLKVNSLMSSSFAFLRRVSSRAIMQLPVAKSLERKTHLINLSIERATATRRCQVLSRHYVTYQCLVDNRCRSLSASDVSKTPTNSRAMSAACSVMR